MTLKLTPKLQVLVNNSQSLLVVLGQTDLLPQLIRQMGPLNGLHIEIAVTFVLEDGRITRIGKRTRMTIAKSSKIMLVTTEGLSCGFGFKGAMAMIDHTPNYIVLYHI